MASGQKKMVINTRERAVSNDINRLQAFADASMTEALRWLLLATMGTDLVASLASTTTTPLTAIILNGLMARPEIGTVNLFIEPGTILMSNPDVSPSVDDSSAKLITDNVGVQTAGALTLTAGGGGTRIDLIEVSRNPAVIDESSSRDIFNPTTGAFSSSLVTKVQSDHLQYRIRLGTPGAGIPALASGWLPIAVASVPNAAVTWNDVAVWDVRPLVADLNQNCNVSQNFPRVLKGWGSVTSVAGGSPVNAARGICEIEYGPWIAGGEFSPLNSGNTGDGLDWSSAEVQPTPVGPSADRPWYLYACFPAGLPRWARYTASSSGVRKPMPFRGIPIFTQNWPTSSKMTTITGGVNLPHGLIATTAGVPVASGHYSLTSVFEDANINGSWIECSPGDEGYIERTPNSGGNTDTPQWNLIDATSHPTGATMVRVQIVSTATLSGGNGTTARIETRIRAFDTDAPVAIFFTNAIFMKYDTKSDVALGGGSVAICAEADIPLHTIANMPAGGAVTRVVHMQMTITPETGTVTAYANQVLRVLGWKMGV